MFYVDLYIINVYVILPPDLGPFAVNTYIQLTFMDRLQGKLTYFVRKPDLYIDFSDPNKFRWTGQCLESHTEVTWARDHNSWNLAFIPYNISI
jgi:hypothetical protein